LNYFHYKKYPLVSGKPIEFMANKQVESKWITFITGVMYEIKVYGSAEKQND